MNNLDHNEESLLKAMGLSEDEGESIVQEGKDFLTSEGPYEGLCKISERLEECYKRNKDHPARLLILLYTAGKIEGEVIESNPLLKLLKVLRSHHTEEKPKVKSPEEQLNEMMLKMNIKSSNSKLN